MNKYLIGIDVGTTAVKLAAFTAAGVMVADAVCEYALQTPQSQWAEADCGIYMEAIANGLACLREQGCDLERAEAIGFSCQSETIFFLDEAHRPLRKAIVWLDNRAVEESAYLSERFTDEECYRVTGQIGFQPAWPASKVLWVKKHQPQVFAATRWIFLMEEFLLFQLTGRAATNGAMLSSSVYWDISAKCYWKDMLHELGIDEGMLPEVVESGQVVGRILPEIAKAFGLNPEAVVCSGGMDNAVGALGAGCVRPGQFAQSIGSSLAVCVPCEKNLRDPHRKMPVHYYVAPDMYLLHTFTTGGMCLRWFRDAFCADEMKAATLQGADAYALMDMQAEKIPAGCEGLLFLPHLSGALSPDANPYAKGVFYGISLKHERAWFMRAVMESIGFVLRRNLEVLSGMGIPVKEVRAYGGGAKSAVWNQINADILQLPVNVTDAQHAGCRGAAILAGKAVGRFPGILEAAEEFTSITASFLPNPANAAVYDTAFERYKGLMSVLHETFARL